MAIDVSGIQNVYGGSKEKASAKEAAAKARLEAIGEEKAAKGESTGKTVGTILGALVGGYFGGPQGAMAGAQAGGDILGVGGKAIAGGDVNSEDLMEVGKGVMSMPGGGELAGIEGAEEGSSISGATAANTASEANIKKYKALLDGGIITKEQFAKMTAK